MIQTQTILKVADNSGAKTAKCIKVLGGFKRKYAYAGDIVVVSIQELRNKAKETAKVKKGEVYRGILIRTKKKTKQKNGEHVNFDENTVVLINKQNSPVGTRIIGGFPKALIKKKFQKFISISSGITS
jgi:large subunit ribosomal protein L14